jgi:hypothetical protein
MKQAAVNIESKKPVWRITPSANSRHAISEAIIRDANIKAE